MVLSNKKLKQQIRDKYAEILISKTPDSEIQANPETPKSLKQFLDSTIQKPRLSKREKRRESFPYGENKDTHVEEASRGKKRRREKIGGEDGGGVGLEVNEKGGQTQNLSNKKKKSEKKEKIDVGEKSGGDVEMGVIDGGEVELGVNAIGVEGENLSIKKIRKKPRWKKNELGVRIRGDVEMSLKEGSDLSTEKRVPVKKKKKKKTKKSKSKAKIEDVENVENVEEKQSVVENVVIPEQIVAETR